MPCPSHPLLRRHHGVSDKPSPSYEDLLRTVEYLMGKKNALLRYLHLAHGTIEEFSRQAGYINRLKQGKSIPQGGETMYNPLSEPQHSSIAELHIGTVRNPNYVQLLGTVQYLMDDCRALSQYRSLTDRTIEELAQQARYASMSGPSIPVVVAHASTWIGGNWLAPSGELLAPAEKMWHQGNAEAALDLIDAVLSRHNLTIEDDVNANLLVSAIKRASGDMAQASKCAEDALVIANEGERYVLASKAQFHRGMCFLGRGQYAQAQFCFALASHLDGYQAQIESKADPQSTKSYWATYGDISRADFNEYKELVTERFNQAQIILDSTMQEISFLKRQHANHRVKWQKELATALTGKDQNAVGRWSRAVRGEIRKPKLVIEQAIDREVRQIQTYGDASAVNEEATETPSDPPLYDNLPDKLRQIAVELLLRRSQVAYILKDWKAMENYSRQAQHLARNFKWEPFVARCAFWTGVALYHLGDWIRAYEDFEAADRTKGYYIPREEILEWLTLSSERLKDPPKLWSNLLLAVKGEQAPGFTPLGTLLEEREDVASPVTEIHTSGDEGTSLPRHSSRANGPSISSANHAILVDAPDLEHSASFDKATSISRRTTDAIAFTPDVHIEPLKARRKAIPTAITLPSTVEPPRVRTPLLYTPGSRPVSGPRSNASINGQDSPLSRNFDEGQNTRLSLSDLGIHSAISPPAEPFHVVSQMSDYPDGNNGVMSIFEGAAPPEEELAGESHPPLPDMTPSSQTEDEYHGLPLDPSSPLSSGGSDDLIPPENPPTPSPPSTITITASAPAPISAPPAETLFSPHPLTTSLQQQNPAEIPLPASPPSTTTTTTINQRISSLRAHHRMRNESIEAAIRNVKTAASPRVQSAKSASSASRYSLQAPWSREMSWRVPALRSQSVRVGRERGRRRVEGGDVLGGGKRGWRRWGGGGDGNGNLEEGGMGGEEEDEDEDEDGGDDVASWIFSRFDGAVGEGRL
ncbi:MAG: hypothetical protein Q9182_000785 [Xanthomendoza sp. 2 TL-2023]